MTQDEIIEMAMQAEFVSRARSTDEESELFVCVDKDIVRFAKLVAAKEREACAKFCETHQVWVGKGKRGFSEWGEEDFVTGGIHQGMDYATAIRARGEQA